MAVKSWTAAIWKLQRQQATFCTFWLPLWYTDIYDFFIFDSVVAIFFIAPCTRPFESS